MRKIIILVLVLPFIVAGCGSGGGGGDSSSSSPQAVVTLSTQSSAALPSNSIRGIELYLDLPAGVSVSTDSTGKTLPGVIVPAGSAIGPNTTIVGNYPVTDPASGNTNSVKIEIVDTDPSGGFNTGDFATVTSNRAAGVSPSAGQFQVNGFNAVDGQTQYITSLSVTYTVLLK